MSLSVEGSRLAQPLVTSPSISWPTTIEGNSSNSSKISPPLACPLKWQSLRRTIKTCWLHMVQFSSNQFKIIRCSSWINTSYSMALASCLKTYRTYHSRRPSRSSTCSPHSNKTASEPSPSRISLQRINRIIVVIED